MTDDLTDRLARRADISCRNLAELLGEARREILRLRAENHALRNDLQPHVLAGPPPVAVPGWVDPDDAD